MHFEQSLRNATYPPWKSHYIDYAKLKKLLRETEIDSDGDTRQSRPDDKDGWSENDESRFVEELVNVQLDKVNKFQATTSKQLRERTSKCENTLDILSTAGDDHGGGAAQEDATEADRRTKLKEVLKELDSITKETHELEKFSRINFTGFLKAAKKHDRKRGETYRVRPLLQVRLAALPFNSEDYSPLLYRWVESDRDLTRSMS
jgi:SPX domain protein involved in polyphosphate accumulation